MGRGRLRASHADREQVIGALKAAFIEGRLAKGEFDLRVGRALASRTHVELAAITADLPAGLAAAEPPTPPRTQDEIMQRPGRMMAVATALYAGVLAFVFLPSWPVNSEGDPPKVMFVLVFVSTFIYLFVLPIGVMNMVALWRKKRFGRQVPPRRAQGGRALEGERDRGPGHDLIPCQADRDTRARRLLGHGVTQHIWPSVPTRQASGDQCV